MNGFGERCKGVPADTLPGYIESVNRLKELRKALARAKRAEMRTISG